MLEQPLHLTKVDFKTAVGIRGTRLSQALGEENCEERKFWLSAGFAKSLATLGYRCLPLSHEFFLVPRGTSTPRTIWYNEMPLLRMAVEWWPLEEIDTFIREVKAGIVAAEKEPNPNRSGGYTKLILEDLVRRNKIHQARMGVERHIELLEAFREILKGYL